MGVLFKVNSSMDHAVLAVKHVFESAAVPPDKDRDSIKPHAAAIQRLESEVNTKEADVPEETDQERKVADPPGGSQGAREVRSQDIKRETNADSYVKESEEQKPTDLPEPEMKTAMREDLPEKKESGSTKTDPLAQEPSIPEDKGRAETQAVVEKESAPDAPMSPESTRDEVPQPVFDRAGLERLARLGADESSVKAPPGPGKIDISEKLRHSSISPERRAKESATHSRQIDRTLAKTGLGQADPKRGEMTVDPQKYMALFNSWRASGNGEKESEKIPLRVQNLRESYELFQMKVIAVIRGDTFLDLSDGTRVAGPSLAEYSTTLFRVDRPWDQWGNALSSAGIRRNERVEIRYYMYDFVKAAIYARVARAVAWCREKGLIAKDLPASSVDVLGKAYAINRQGGGRFGVFVPVSLDTRDGRTVSIDPACFRGQADVAALQVAGLL